MSDPDRFLLDTHAFIWLATDDARLSDRAKVTVLDPASRLYLSAASVWEIAIKKGLGRIEIEQPLGEFVHSQLEALAAELLDIRLEHVLGVESLPVHHRNPFDRLLIAACLAENLQLISGDPLFDHYGVRRVW